MTNRQTANKGRYVATKKPLIRANPKGMMRPTTMPKTINSGNIQSLVNDFVSTIVATVETATTERVRAALASALGGARVLRRGPGRPPKAAARVVRIRRAGPKQLCPVPGCPNPAAPVFGMVCSKHKDVPKPQIKKYREQRRASKEKALSAAA